MFDGHLFLKHIFIVSFISLCLQLLSFLQGLFTFYHEGYELAQEFAPYKQQLQFNLQNVRLYLFLLPLLSESDDDKETNYNPAKPWSRSKIYLI